MVAKEKVARLKAVLEEEEKRRVEAGKAAEGAYLKLKFADVIGRYHPHGDQSRYYS